MITPAKGTLPMKPRQAVALLFWCLLAAVSAAHLVVLLLANVFSCFFSYW